ncbi:DUF3050 family protein [Sinobacterium caligoides]|uniref:DUF3050 family protein n=1 Tax=Sinobacterium caligoides TaxID=933926 RepID=A0A3N2E075_9GAMM|nr:DUF3050 domain-containing protein [Sinobacterium caligoides]ROS05099.1 DUF3050 family protein [Sinobacterium caligoides]
MNIENNIAETRKHLTAHKIYESISSVDDLRIFMSAHVFAVWDFMSLAKRLQTSMTCTVLPWQTPSDPFAARLINEIIFYEETDIDHNGQPGSHLDMYLSAMREIGADTSLFDSFTHALTHGKDVPEALACANVPHYIAHFVTNNIHCAIEGQLEEVASSFLFGREDAIPDMFTLFLEKWKVDRKEIPALVYYLERHIDLDGDEHGPAAHKILNNLIGDDKAKEERASQSAINAISDRVGLWDGILLDIEKSREKAEASKKDKISLDYIKQPDSAISERV